MSFAFSLHCSWLREVVKFQDQQTGLKNAPQTLAWAFVQIYDGEQIILFILTANSGPILYVKSFYPRLRHTCRAAGARLTMQISHFYNTAFTFHIVWRIPYSCSNYCANNSAFRRQYLILRLFILRTTTTSEPG
jgi:hypothetical protein